MIRYILVSEAITTLITMSWIRDPFNVKVAEFEEYIPGFQEELH